MDWLRRGIASPGGAWRLVIAALALYAIGFVLYYPSVITVDDEAAYVQQAMLFARGQIAESHVDPLTGETHRAPLSTYPVGTSALQAPFVALGGWQAAIVASILALGVMVLGLARWLEDEGRSPIYALLALAYPPTLVLGRIAMSDVPSGALVTVGLWFFWRGLDRGWGWWLASGLVAGLSFAFREANPLFLVPFFAGAVFRRERNAFALIVGGALGLVPRFIGSALVFGSAFYTRHVDSFSLVAAFHNFPIYLVSMVVFVPGGLAVAALYHGRRRPEVLTALAAGFGFYLLYNFSAAESGLFRRVVMGPRFLIPLVALSAFAMAEVIPRALASRPRLARVGSLAVAAWIASVMAASLGVHPVMGYWSSLQAGIARALYEYTTPQAVVITNSWATGKFLNRIYGSRVTLDRSLVSPARVGTLLASRGAVELAFLDRFDSPARAQDAQANEAFRREVAARCQLESRYDAVQRSGERLRIWSVVACPRPAASPLVTPRDPLLEPPPLCVATEFVPFRRGKS